VVQERQGISRRLTVDALLILALALLLIQELELTTLKALEVAKSLATNEGNHIVPQGLSLTLDLQSFRTRLLQRLENAVEIAPIPTRGRPPGSKTGRLD
jgi:hypothetical protein